MPRLPLLLPRELDDSSLRDESLIPELERSEPDDALMPSSLREVERSLLLLLLLLLPLLLDEPLFEALRPPERSCELPRPELVLPEAPSPSLRSLLSPMLLELRSLELVLRLLSEAL